MPYQLQVHFKFVCNDRPIPLAAWFSAWVGGRSLVCIAGFNSAGSMDVCCDCCVLSGRGLQRADPTPKGVLPSVCVFQCD
jgi:hypothetical protein